MSLTSKRAESRIGKRVINRSKSLYANLDKEALTELAKDILDKQAFKEEVIKARPGASSKFWDTNPVSAGFPEYAVPTPELKVDTLAPEAPAYRANRLSNLIKCFMLDKPEILRKRDKYTFNDFLETIGYPEPYPNIYEIEDIRYENGNLELVYHNGNKPEDLGDSPEPYNEPGHRIQQPKSKASRPFSGIATESTGGDIPNGGVKIQYSGSSGAFIKVATSDTTSPQF